MSNTVGKDGDSYEDINSRDEIERMQVATLLKLPENTSWNEIFKKLLNIVLSSNEIKKNKPDPRIRALEIYFKRLKQKELDSKKEEFPIIEEIINDTGFKIFEKIIKNEENIFLTKKPAGKSEPLGRTERFAREKQLADDMGKGRKKYEDFSSIDELEGLILNDVKGLEGTGISYDYNTGNFLAETGIKIITNPDLYKNHPLKSAEITFGILPKEGEILKHYLNGKVTIHYLDYRK